MPFVQIIEFDSSRIDEMHALDAEWGKRSREVGATARRAILAADRDRPNHFMQIVFFDSYEDAMRNSELPFTQEMAQKMGALADGEPTFHNLEIRSDNSY
jgi:hypothetical protein